MWVARDKDGSLWIYFDDKPKKSHDKWWATNQSVRYCRINSSLFPDLRWEDEPIEVKLVRKED